MNAPRKLAAILAADVAGYSRLTGIDEEGTLRRLRKLRRELINPAVSLHRGRIVKTTGDGILIEFPSVVDAVRCALDVQRGMDGRNADLPADQRIEFRVGSMSATWWSRARTCSGMVSTSRLALKESRKPAASAFPRPRISTSATGSMHISRTRASSSSRTS